MIKRLFDVFISLFCVVLLSPIFIIVSILIKFDGGPIIFKQIRVGLNGKPFGIYKFRSMVNGADKMGGYSTMPGDNRITSVGKFIRKTSIDELPQLLNILLGHMSLVGPRPNVLAQRTEYTQEQWELRNAVLPGITGIAQSRKRSSATWQERYDMDIEYVKKSTFLLDLKIIRDTFMQVLFKGGH